MTPERSMAIFFHTRYRCLDSLMAPDVHIPPGTLYVAQAHRHSGRVLEVGSPVSLALVGERDSKNFLLCYEPSLDVVLRPSQKTLFCIEPWFYTEVLKQTCGPQYRHLALVVGQPHDRQSYERKLQRADLSDFV